MQIWEPFPLAASLPDMAKCVRVRWIPACAGMTVKEAGVTGKGAGMTVKEAGVRE